MNKTLSLLRPLAALALSAALIAPAAAGVSTGFSGSYAAANWSSSNSNGGNGSVSAGSDSLLLTSSDFSLIDADPAESTLSYGITVSEGSMISFSWLYSTEDVSSSYDIFGYSINGVFTQLSSDGLSFLDSQDGSLSVWVAAGSTFAFVLESSDSEGGAATVTISDFNAVPEPGSIALLGAGLGALGLVRRSRRRVG